MSEQNELLPCRIANRAWNNLNMARSILHTSGITKQAEDLLSEAQDLCDKIVSGFTPSTPSPEPDITKAEAGIMTMKTCPRCGYDGTMPFHTCNVPKQNEIPTPRTDAKVESHFSKIGWSCGEMANFARTLERELIELRRLSDGLYNCLKIRQKYLQSMGAEEALDAYQQFLARHPEMAEKENHGKLE